MMFAARLRKKRPVCRRRKDALVKQVFADPHLSHGRWGLFFVVREGGIELRVGGWVS